MVNVFRNPSLVDLAYFLIFCSLLLLNLFLSSRIVIPKMHKLFITHTSSSKATNCCFHSRCGRWEISSFKIQLNSSRMNKWHICSRAHTHTVASSSKDEKTISASGIVKYLVKFRMKRIYLTIKLSLNVCAMLLQL